MVSAAHAEGIELTGGGYRSTAQQIELRKLHCGTSDYAVYQMPASSCIPPTAIPGQSLHEFGLAIDFANCDSQQTPVFWWLTAYAAGYGFKNLASESWHWSTTGH